MDARGLRVAPRHIGVVGSRDLHATCQQNFHLDSRKSAYRFSTADRGTQRYINLQKALLGQPRSPWRDQSRRDRKSMTPKLGASPGTQDLSAISTRHPNWSLWGPEPRVSVLRPIGGRSSELSKAIPARWTFGCQAELSALISFAGKATL